MEVQGAVSMKAMKLAVKNEPRSRKIIMGVASVVQLLGALIIGSIYLSWYKNQNDI